MRKRVGIARAIALRPKYILYDEPTTGLDPVTSAVIDQLMVRMRDRLGVTSIVITHDMRSAYTVGTRIAMLYQGRVRAVGSVDEIKHSTDPDRPPVRRRTSHAGTRSRRLAAVTTPATPAPASRWRERAAAAACRPSWSMRNASARARSCARRFRGGARE